MSKTAINAVKTAIDRYKRREISGKELGSSLRLNLNVIEGVDVETQNSIGYFENFFEMEGEDLYESNRYIDEEIKDLIALVDTLGEQ